jgi:dolichol-phosphate mannosyltransferase
MRKVSVVVPVYFNEESLPHLFSRLEKLVDDCPGSSFEFVFVDDGSGDASLDLLRRFRKQHPATIVKLSRNFGSMNACLAGLEVATGDCVVIISADLQDPPELIPEMLRRWERGSDVVMAVRAGREDPLVSRFFAAAYYRMIRRWGLPAMPTGGFDFVLMDRKIAEVIRQCDERNTSVMGLIAWAGFKQDHVPYVRRAREHGRSRWTLAGRIKYFADAFVAFSSMPVRLIQLGGLFTACLGALYSVVVAYARLRYGLPVQGLAALIIIVLVSNGVLMVMLGVLGEYVWRIADESRKRPRFVVDSLESADAPAAVDPGAPTHPAR